MVERADAILDRRPGKEPRQARLDQEPRQLPVLRPVIADQPLGDELVVELPQRQGQDVLEVGEDDLDLFQFSQRPPRETAAVAGGGGHGLTSPSTSRTVSSATADKDADDAPVRATKQARADLTATPPPPATARCPPAGAAEGRTGCRYPSRARRTACTCRVA